MKFSSFIFTLPLLAAVDAKFPLTKVRSYDGSDGNPGAEAGSELRRVAGAHYPGDGSGSRMTTFPNPRTASNIALQAPEEQMPNNRKLTDFVWAWGQFIDHDMDLTPSDEGAGTADIMVKGGNDVMGKNTELPFTRSLYVDGSGVSRKQPRTHTNLITSVLDASMVYGHSKERCDFLRTFKGGKMKTYNNERSRSRMLLPLNTGGFPNEGNDHFEPNELFMAGDLRSNEQLTLVSLHTLFLREHNRLCNAIKRVHPRADDENIFQAARKIVGMEIQKITYDEWLPALLGPMANKFKRYRGYHKKMHAGITAEFAGAAFRFGHSMISPNIEMMNRNSKVTTSPLRDSFFPQEFIKEKAFRVDEIIMGLTQHMAQEIDMFLIEDIRSFLFGEPGDGGMDLAALNIQRGRDMGLGNFNKVRAAYGLKPVKSFERLSSNPMVVRRLKKAYPNIESLDLFVGCLAEDHVRGASVGLTLGTIIVDQFDRLMHGDKFFYLNDPDLSRKNLARIFPSSKMTLANVVGKNTYFKPNRLSNLFVMDRKPRNTDS